MKLFHTLLFLFIAMFLLPSLSSLADDRIEIVLKNGSVFSTGEYFEKDNQICTYRYGSLVRIPKSNIIEIRNIENIDNVEEITPDPSLVQKRKHKQYRSTKSASRKISKMDECERNLQMFRKRKQTYCPEPKIPQTYHGSISEKNFNRFQTHVKSQVAAFKASRTCNYYKDMVEYWEKKCGK